MNFESFDQEVEQASGYTPEQLDKHFPDGIVPKESPWKSKGYERHVHEYESDDTRSTRTHTYQAEKWNFTQVGQELYRRCLVHAENFSGDIDDLNAEFSQIRHEFGQEWAAYEGKLHDLRDRINQTFLANVQRGGHTTVAYKYKIIDTDIWRFSGDVHRLEEAYKAHEWRNYAEMLSDFESKFDELVELAQTYHQRLEAINDAASAWRYDKAKNDIRYGRGKFFGISDEHKSELVDLWGLLKKGGVLDRSDTLRISDDDYASYMEAINKMNDILAQHSEYQEQEYGFIHKAVKADLEERGKGYGINKQMWAVGAIYNCAQSILALENPSQAIEVLEGTRLGREQKLRDLEIELPENDAVDLDDALAITLSYLHEKHSEIFSSMASDNSGKSHQEDASPAAPASKEDLMAQLFGKFGKK